jgi:hypothetical protein
MVERKSNAERKDSEDMIDLREANRSRTLEVDLQHKSESLSPLKLWTSVNCLAVFIHQRSIKV